MTYAIREIPYWLIAILFAGGLVLAKCDFREMPNSQPRPPASMVSP